MATPVLAARILDASYKKLSGKKCDGCGRAEDVWIAPSKHDHKNYCCSCWESYTFLKVYKNPEFQLYFRLADFVDQEEADEERVRKSRKVESGEAVPTASAPASSVPKPWGPDYQYQLHTATAGPYQGLCYAP